MDICLTESEKSGVKKGKCNMGWTDGTEVLSQGTGVIYRSNKLFLVTTMG